MKHQTLREFFAKQLRKNPRNSIIEDHQYGVSGNVAEWNNGLPVISADPDTAN